jgi:hypothetical protein
MIRKDAASLFRIAVAEAPRAPKLGAIFYAQGPGTTLKRLAKYLRAAADRGELRCREPLRAAEPFLGAVVAQHHLRCLIGQRHAPISETRMRACAGGCVDASCALSSRAAVMAQPLPAALHLNASATSCRINEGLPDGTSVARTLNEILVPEMQRLIE